MHAWIPVIVDCVPFPPFQSDPVKHGFEFDKCDLHPREQLYILFWFKYWICCGKPFPIVGFIVLIPNPIETSSALTYLLGWQLIVPLFL